MPTDDVLLAPGLDLELDVERVAVGGRMIARHEGRVVLIAGGIPGERVVARVERVQRDLVYAAVVAVLRPHPARRDPGRDPACGGMTYSHVAPDHQRTLKVQAIADAFARIGHIDLVEDVPVAPSPEAGYRMRARVHLRGGRVGSFREGSHEICDLAQTGQLSQPCLATLAAVAEICARHDVADVDAIEVAENLDATERALNLEHPFEPGLAARLCADLAALGGVAGVTWAAGRGMRAHAAGGRPWVEDPLAAYLTERVTGPPDATIRRHPSAFFQANRFLTPLLARRVTEALLDGPVLDLYAGVGLFALCAAACGHEAVVAIEGDAVSASDLEANARVLAPRLRVERLPVEVFLQHVGPSPPATVIVDPPRTGMSRAALGGVVSLAARRIIYVSCDVATLARDARRLVEEGGYRLERLSALDLFPNTPHIEAVALFDLVTPRGPAARNDRTAGATAGAGPAPGRQPGKPRTGRRTSPGARNSPGATARRGRSARRDARRPR